MYVVSIHAPAQGATSLTLRQRIIQWVSIHAPAQGATVGTWYFKRARRFQFTPLRKGRHTRALASDCLHDRFNSRPCARGDTAFYQRFIAAAKFQFTPLRKGRHCRPAQAAPPFEFQFTPLRKGRRALESTLLQKSTSFNSRPCARGDLCVANQVYARGVGFNSRPCARGDASDGKLVFTEIKVSIHAPAQGATRTSRLRWALWRFQFTPLRKGRRQGDHLLHQAG